MSQSEPPLVSVVVPFYNTCRYLDICIRSVLAQDYPEFELILSDNCSDDGSSEVARRFAEEDARVRYRAHDEFLAQVPNYNRALTEISEDSRYTKIVQADDWIYPDCLRKMVTVAQSHADIGLVSSYRLKGRRVTNVGLPPDRERFDGREVCRRQLLEGMFFVGSPTAVLYASEVVRERSPFYSEDSLHEDTEACYEILREWDMGFVHQVLSFARVRDESISAEGEEHDPHLLDKLIVIDRYGEDFLTPEEHRSVWKTYSQRYYDHLGRGALRARGRDFWAYHRQGLATIDRRIRPVRVAAGIVRVLLTLLLNPLNTATLLLRRAKSVVRKWTRSGDRENPAAEEPTSSASKSDDSRLPPAIAKATDGGARRADGDQ